MDTEAKDRAAGIIPSQENDRKPKPLEKISEGSAYSLDVAHCMGGFRITKGVGQSWGMCDSNIKMPGCVC